MMRIKVTRTLVHEGSAEWVNRTIASSFIQDDKPFETPLGNIYQSSITEEIEESNETS